MARRPVGQRALLIERRPHKEPRQFAQRIQPHLARGSNQRMPMQDDHFAIRLLRQFVQTLAQVEFLSSKQLVVESAKLSERRRFAKDERPGKQALRSAEKVPKAREEVRQRIAVFESNRATARQAVPGLNLLRDFLEQRRAGMRIRINEQEPVAGGDLCAAIAGTGDLIDRLADDGSSASAGNFGGAIGGIVVADDQFRFPVELAESDARRLHASERFTQQPLFVEGGNDNRDLQFRECGREFVSGSILNSNGRRWRM